MIFWKKKGNAYTPGDILCKQNVGNITHEIENDKDETASLAVIAVDKHRRVIIRRLFKESFDLCEKTVFGDFRDLFGIFWSPVDFEVAETLSLEEAGQRLVPAVYHVFDLVRP